MKNNKKMPTSICKHKVAFFYSELAPLTRDVKFSKLRGGNSCRTSDISDTKMSGRVIASYLSRNCRLKKLIV